MTDLRGVLRELGIGFAENGQSSHVTGGWVGLKCPRCDNGRGNFGLGISLRSLRANCWRCGSLPLAVALSEASGRPVGAVRALLGGLAPESAPEAAPGRLELPAGLGDLEPAHRRYLEKRGFDPDELIEQRGVRGIGELGGALAWRLFLPVRDRAGRTVSWTTRAIGNVPHRDRYRGAAREQSAVPRGECLGGEDLAGHAVAVCEGAFSSFRIGPGGVWTAGVGYSRAQILKIARYPVRVICFDNEPAAQRRATALARSLEAFAGETYVVVVSAADPAEASQEEINEIRRRFLE